MDASFGDAASSGSSSPSARRTSFISSRVASFASISASRASTREPGREDAVVPRRRGRCDFKIDGGSVDDVSDDARARSS